MKLLPIALAVLTASLLPLTAFTAVRAEEPVELEVDSPAGDEPVNRVLEIPQTGPIINYTYSGPKSDDADETSAASAADSSDSSVADDPSSPGLAVIAGAPANNAVSDSSGSDSSQIAGLGSLQAQVPDGAPADSMYPPSYGEMAGGPAMMMAGPAPATRAFVPYSGPAYPAPAYGSVASARPAYGPAATRASAPGRVVATRPAWGIPRGPGITGSVGPVRSRGQNPRRVH